MHTYIFLHVGSPSRAMELETSKCRRVDHSTARSVEGAAEWRLHNIGVMRSFYATPGRPRGGCECEHFHLPGFPEVQFTFMVHLR